MKAVWLVALFLPLAVFADVPSPPNSCESAPPDAVVKLDAPYSSWFSIECDDVMKAHFLVAGPDFVWKEFNTGRSYRFNAYGPISPQFSPLELNIYEPHKYHFIKAVPSVMREEQLTGVNRLLPDGVGPYSSIHQLDLNTSTRRTYNFFVYLRGSVPEWIVACVNYQCGRRAIIQVTQK